MIRRNSFLTLFVALLLTCSFASAGPPLPLHNVEGNSGVFLTSTAYLANPPEKDGPKHPLEEGASNIKSGLDQIASNGFGLSFWTPTPATDHKILGMPSFSASGAFIGEKDFQSFAVTQNILGRIEIGYAFERLGLGDWPDDVFLATGGVNVINSVQLHNLNTRIMVIAEEDFDCSWMPAVTVGAHFKWNDDLEQLNDQLGGLCNVLGADHDFGTEFTAVASKTISGLLPRPIIVSAGLRNGDAIHTGFVGFAGERRTTFEGSVIVFLTDRLAFASEYRQKTDLLDQLSAGGEHLIKAENDWWDLCLAYVIDDHLTISGGYANFGNVLNHHEDNVWAFQLKYEF